MPRDFRVYLDDIFEAARKIHRKSASQQPRRGGMN
jgi:hypothetical protein